MQLYADKILHRHRWTVTEYHRMGEVGLLTEDARVELIDGEIIEMAPIGSKHGGKVKRLNRLFASRVGDRGIVSAQDPIVLGDYAEPQPDLALLRWRDDYYEEAHPGPVDVLLVVEVSDTTAQYDRDVKIPLYARHNIPEVWLLNVQEQCLEIYRKPENGNYRQVEKHLAGGVAPAKLPEVVIELEELFPPSANPKC